MDVEFDDIGAHSHGIERALQLIARQQLATCTMGNIVKALRLIERSGLHPIIDRKPNQYPVNQN
jgi:hypothetical protein